MYTKATVKEPFQLNRDEFALPFYLQKQTDKTNKNDSKRKSHLVDSWPQL